MARYILKRLLWIIPVVLGVTIMVFTIMYLTPGDPARMILGSNATEEKVEELHEQLGMNGNYFQRLGRYMKQVFIDHDLGSSYYTGVRVTDQIKARLPFTLRIAGISILIAACIGIPLGVLAATHHYTWIDNLAMFGSLFCVSMPGFWFLFLQSSLDGCRPWESEAGPDTSFPVFPAQSVERLDWQGRRAQVCLR